MGSTTLTAETQRWRRGFQIRTLRSAALGCNPFRFQVNTRPFFPWRHTIIRTVGGFFQMPNTLTRTFILRLGILFLVSLLAGSSDAQETAPSPKVQIIPQPRQWTITQDKFRFGSGASIALADPHSEDDLFAARDFIDDVKQTAGVELKIGKGRARQVIVIGNVDLPLVQTELKRAGIESPADLDAEGY